MGYEKFLEMVYKKLVGMGYKKFLRMVYKKFLRTGYKKFLRIGSYLFPGNNHKKISSPGRTPATVRFSSQELLNEESFPGNSRENLQFLSTFSPDFPVKESWEFPRILGKAIPRIFRKIVTWESSFIL